MEIWELPIVPRLLQKFRNQNDILMCGNFLQFRFQFSQLVVIEWRGNLVLQLMSQKTFHFVLENSRLKNVASQKIDSAESQIDGIVMRNEGIKQEEVMALFAEGAVVDGKWGDILKLAANAFVRSKAKNHPIIFHSGPLSSKLRILEIYNILSSLQPVTVNQCTNFWRKQLSRLALFATFSENVSKKTMQPPQSFLMPFLFKINPNENTSGCFYLECWLNGRTGMLEFSDGC